MTDERGLPSPSDTRAAAGRDSLASLLMTFARQLHSEADPHTTLVQIVNAAIDLVPGCDEASISVVLGRRKVSSEAASGELPRVVDELQERFQQGPCIDAAYEHRTVRVADLATETRWPLFAAAASEQGARSMLSLQLYVEEDDLGALNLFSRTAGAFTDESERVGLMLAAHAAVAYAATRQVERMSRGLLSQQVIGQAQGILMERHKITSDAAFRLMVQASQSANTKLRDVAQQLVHSGELPALDSALVERVGGNSRT